MNGDTFFQLTPPDRDPDNHRDTIVPACCRQASLREATLYTHLLVGNNNPFYQHLNVKYSIWNTQYSKLTPN